jgi:hypothetical protein
MILNIAYSTVRVALLFGSILLLACTPQNQTPLYKTPSSASEKASWYAQSHDFFINTQHTEINGFAKKLDELLLISNDIGSTSVTLQTLSVESVLSRHFIETKESEEQRNPAQQVIEEKIDQQLLAHQLASFGEIYLSVNDINFVKQNPLWAAYIESLKRLSEMSDVFKNGELNIYEANDNLGLFAYQRSKNNTRAFVAFNFSFDNHELPLPFGFMASTKVSMWQSDSPEIQTFVTSQALTIRPYTAVIIIVGL